MLNLQEPAVSAFDLRPWLGPGGSLRHHDRKTRHLLGTSWAD
jgi:hypothetical protein